MFTTTNLGRKIMPATIAAIQMCSSNIVDENLATAKRLIAEAARNNAKLIVLPEMFAIMGLAATDKVNAREIFGKGKIQDFLSQEAKSNKVWIVAGTIPIECDDQTKVRAASLVFNDKGNCVARYDKAHLFDVTLSEKKSIKSPTQLNQATNSLLLIPHLES
jgi:deaminated glutathione amidase